LKVCLAIEGGLEMAAHLNFINDGSKTYLTVDGHKVGYYRQRLVTVSTTGYVAVFKNPYQEQDFDTEQQCQDWLRSLI
jgi:hypothetical protein